MKKVALNNRNKCYFSYLIFDEDLELRPKKVLHVNVPVKQHLSIVSNAIDKIEKIGCCVVRYDSHLEKLCYYDNNIKRFDELNTNTIYYPPSVNSIRTTNTIVRIELNGGGVHIYAYNQRKYDAYDKIIDFTDPNNPVIIKE